MPHVDDIAVRNVVFSDCVSRYLRHVRGGKHFRGKFASAQLTEKEMDKRNKDTIV